MSGKGKDLDQILDQSLDQIRESQLDPAAEKAAADRVWERVSQEIGQLSEPDDQRQQIRDCEDFQALIPAYLRQGLTDAKALLLEDHVGECLPCRKALKLARNAHRRSDAPAGPSERNWATTLAWRVAAAAAIFVALVGLSIKTDLLTLETGGLIQIESVQGEVFQVTDDEVVPLTEGERVSFEDVSGVRTGKGSSALVRLDDGSLVEMNERAELAVKQRRKLWERGNGDGVIDLARGNIIVEASDQGSGNLFVETGDCDVAVTGTVFAVNTGIKGSRVSVIEGEVEVAYAGQEEILLPGDQTTTRDGLAAISIEDEIAWSANLEQHLALLHELARVTREIDLQLQGPGLRYSTDLLDRAPAGTVIYIGIPNVTAMVSEAYVLLQEQIAGNELLSQWWNDSVAGTEVESELQRVMDKVRTYGEQLGEEVAVTMKLADHGDPENPLILTRLTDPRAFRELIEAELAGLAQYGDEAPGVCIVEAGSECADGDDLFLSIHGDYLAISPEISAIRDFVGTMQQGGRSAFAAGSFHARLADSYADGVQWLVAMDLETMIAQGPDTAEQASLERLGLLDMQHVIVERKELGETAENRAVLTFDQARRGLPAWLAEPAPMGSLEFISSEAYFAGGFVMKEPASVVDELFAFLGAEEQDFQQSLDEFEQQHGIDVREDIAAALGGEFAFALEPPVLPKPSWKLIMEVYDPARLQATVEWAAGRINQLLQDEGRQGLRTGQSESGGRVYYEIESLDTGISAHYMFVDGYMVASASRALLERSLQFRAAGTTLTRTPRFMALMPQDGQVNFSAVMYQNMGPVLGPLARMSQGAAANISPAAEEMLAGLGSMTAPSLTLAYGEPNRIVFVNTSEGGILAASLGRFLSLDGLFSVQQLVGQAVGEAPPSDPIDVNEG